MSHIVKPDPKNKDYAIEKLKRWLPINTTVYMLKRHTTRGAVPNYVYAVLISRGGNILNISNLVADALGLSWYDSDGVMTRDSLAVVRELSYLMHGIKSKGDTTAPGAGTMNFKAGFTLEHSTL